MNPHTTLPSPLPAPFETAVKSKRGDSRIFAGAGLLARAGELLAANTPARRVIIAADENAAKRHLPALEASLAAAGIRCSTCVVPAGEESKSITGLSRLWDEFHKAGITRSDMVVAFGGGVTGDLAGFASATWLRGVPVAQIPTTLLAMVDSAIGGKTAIDLPCGKNLAGAFHQPRLVLIDPELLSSLPPSRFSEGMAEVIKYGCIMDAGLFEQLENRGSAPLPPAALESVICRCAQLKAETVSRDEFDTGERMLLNFGHTFGHALEKVLGYSSISHGEAVAIGMASAALAGEKLSITPSGTSARIAAVARSFSLPATVGEFLEREARAAANPLRRSPPLEELAEAMLADKKNLSGQIQLILLNRIGAAIATPFPCSQLRDIFI